MKFAAIELQDATFQLERGIFPDEISPCEVPDSESSTAWPVVRMGVGVREGVEVERQGSPTK